MRQLSEVDLSDPEDIKVTANEGGGTLLIHLGGNSFLERYKLYVSHIGEWRQQFQNLQSVDLRYEGQIIVNPDKPAGKREQRRRNARRKRSRPMEAQENWEESTKSPALKAFVQ